MCFSITGKGLYVTCSQDKWDKGKAIVEDLRQAVVVNDENLLTRALLEKDVGFLVHLSPMFPALFPYFKGIYHTMKSWCLGRNSDSWKLSNTAWWNLMAGAVVDDEDDELRELPFDEACRIFSRRNQAEQPAKVKPVGRLSNDLKAL